MKRETRRRIAYIHFSDDGTICSGCKSMLILMDYNMFDPCRDRGNTEKVFMFEDAFE